MSTSLFHWPAGPASDHLAAIVESSDDAILSKDPTGRIMSWNPAATRMYGYAPDEAVGRPISMLIPPHRAGEEMQILRRILAGERVSHYETERLTKDGRVIMVSLTVSPVRNAEGTVLGASVIARDVTSRHRRARLSALLHDVTAKLSRAVTPSDVVDVTVEHAVEAFGADAVAFGVRQNGEVRIAASGGRHPERIARPESFPLEADEPMAEAMRTRAPVWASESGNPTNGRSRGGEDWGGSPAVIVLPLVAGDAALGALSVSFERPHEFDAEERALLFAASQQAAYALGRAQIYELERLDAERQAFLGEAGGLLAGSRDPRGTLVELSELSVRHLADFACAYLMDDAGELHVAAVAHSHPDLRARTSDLAEQLKAAPGDGIVGRVLDGAGELHGDSPGKPWLDDDPAAHAIARSLDAHSLLVAPLRARDRALGALVLGAAAVTRRYDSPDLALAEDLGQRAGLAVANAQLFRREHEAAVTLQRALLPQGLPEIEGLEFAARYEPAAPGLQVGGDWYEVVSVDDGTVGLTIGDVAGRGLRAAAVMGRIRPALAAYVLDGHRPQEAVGRLDRLMRELADPVMTTIFHMQFDRSRACARFVRAGHPPALLRTPDGAVTELEGTGNPPVGVLSDVTYAEDEVAMPAGSLLLLYTDGLIERRDLDLREGLARLKRSLAEAPPEPHACLDWLSDQLGCDDVPDDVAMLAVAT
ncbi:MAG TPA: SpoIIE family protein phosphatase [Solirubrobacterales bacterium]|jgi:PAS domain S-box-containing protein